VTEVPDPGIDGSGFRVEGPNLGDSMKTRVLLPAFFLIATSAAFAGDGSVPLPASKTDGRMSVEKALKTRRSFRDPKETPLTLAQVGQLCWAAQGVTGDKGHRAAPFTEDVMAVLPVGKKP
jgi:hypothetical protein